MLPSISFSALQAGLYDVHDTVNDRNVARLRHCSGVVAASQLFLLGHSTILLQINRLATESRLADSGRKVGGLALQAHALLTMCP